jgi:hypothetical protein
VPEIDPQEFDPLEMLRPGGRAEPFAAVQLQVYGVTPPEAISDPES